MEQQDSVRHNTVRHNTLRHNTLCDDALGLLGTVLIGHGVAARITEVEAYAGPDDAASHAFRRTPRSEIMFGPAGRLYVYRIHGHHCANVVSGEVGDGAAVLLRAAQIVDGHTLARERRESRRSGPLGDRHLARGPGNLCLALGISMADLGSDLDRLPSDDGASFPVRLDRTVRVAPVSVSAGPRVGVRNAADVGWRFWVTDDPTVSAYRRHPRAVS